MMTHLLATRPAPIALRARLLFPICGPPLRDAMLTIAGERIVAVSANTSGQPATDLGNVALLPGLVNAHTHLEFSDLPAPIGAAGQPLPQWIRQVIGHRRAASVQSSSAVRTGLAEAARTGTTTIGEIATADWTEPARPHADVTCFREAIGLLPEQIESQLAQARAHLDRPWRIGDDMRPGLSPHAPYSVNRELLSRLVLLAGARHVPVAMHLAESREELELLAGGTGPFRAMLEELNVWPADGFLGGLRVLDFLRELSQAPRALVIHGNYLASDEIEFLAAHADRMSLVYCPRTHAWFGHDSYPLAQMLAAGVHIALGTDSRASNPDLSLLEEMRHLARHHASVEPAKVLELGTLAGARALGLAREVGTLEPGKLANLVVVPLPDGESDDPYALVFDSDRPVSQTWYRGQTIAGADDVAAGC